MKDIASELRQRSIDPRSVRAGWPFTSPRTYGVYRLNRPGVSRKFRFGNHPVRMKELEREFSSCSLDSLFLSRKDAKALAASLNKSNA